MDFSTLLDLNMTCIKQFDSAAIEHQEAHLAPYLFSWDYFAPESSADLRDVTAQQTRKRKAPETLHEYAEYLHARDIYPPAYKRQKLSPEDADERSPVHSSLSSLVSSPECPEYYIEESEQSCSDPESPSNEYKSSEESHLELPKLISDAAASSTIPSEKIWRTLREKMRYNHIHQKEVAKDIGVSPSTISAYMNRKCRLNGWHSLELSLARWLEKNEDRFNLNIKDYTKTFKLTEK